MPSGNDSNGHNEDFIISSTDQREKREIDPSFLRRYNHLKHAYRHNPFAFTFLKYFLRNRGQRRERRQVDNSDFNSGGFDNPYITYSNPNQQQPLRPTTQRTKDAKRETTRRRKPFRPPMVFF
ncbi:hypothetical protein BDFB_012616 [Asbolus verrucosus]|uniref:Uncharacterized protein n=1 Tax=Asbolus verrucosus TaxID=1661398 RepID=A0A482VDA6_ASBVE|nr:hypothetical protein BDFB_012616 [Asbolus verrucosus]